MIYQRMTREGESRLVDEYQPTLRQYHKAVYKATLTESGLRREIVNNENKKSKLYSLFSLNLNLRKKNL